MLSVALTCRPMPHWRRLERQLIDCALPLARERTGNSNDAKIAMIAMTTSNSIKVKAHRRARIRLYFPLCGICGSGVFLDARRRIDVRFILIIPRAWLRGQGENVRFCKQRAPRFPAGPGAPLLQNRVSRRYGLV